MGRRFRVSRVVIGALAMCGWYFALLRGLDLCGVSGSWLDLIGYGGGGLFGALAAGGAAEPPRWWEDLAAGLLFGAGMAMMLAVAPIRFVWQPALAQHLVLAVLTTGLAAAAAIAGGRAGGLVHRGDEGRGRVWLLSASLVLGLLWTMFVAAGAAEGMAVLVVALAALIGGGLSQALAAWRMPWTCGAGGLAVLVFSLQYASQQHDAAAVGPAVVLAGIMWLLGAGGAAIVLRISPRPRRGQTLPPAQLHRGG